MENGIYPPEDEGYSIEETAIKEAKEETDMRLNLFANWGLSRQSYEPACFEAKLLVGNFPYRK